MSDFEGYGPEQARPPRYTAQQRILHWLLALLALAVLAGGLTLGILGFEGVTEMLGEEQRNMLYEYHKTGGLIILGLMVIRLVVKMDKGRPVYDPPIAGWQRLLSLMVHSAFYILLIAQPILGWLATDASDFPVEFFHWDLPQFIAKDEAMGEALYHWHGLIGWTLAALIVIHVAAALTHAIFWRDRVINRMRPW